MNITISLNENMAAKLVEAMAKALSCITTSPKESEDIQSLQKSNAALQEQLNLAQQRLASLEAQSIKIAAPSNQAARPEAMPTSPVAQDSVAQSQEKQIELNLAQFSVPTSQEKQNGTTEPDQEKAEKWVRENLAEWLDTPCPFLKAGKRTWKQLAQNQGEKIPVKGKPALPRAYLHSLESWPHCNVWPRLKAKVALEIGNGNGNHS